jgi:hypothetical protein
MPMSMIPYNVMPFQVRLPSEVGAGAGAAAGADCAWAKPGALKAANTMRPPQPNLTPRAIDATGVAVFFG